MITGSPKYTVEDIRRILTPIAQRYGVKSVSLFGSYARGEATEDSDIDLLVEKGDMIRALKFAHFYNELQDAFGIHVDVLTTAMLSDAFLESIREDLRLLYSV